MYRKRVIERPGETCTSTHPLLNLAKRKFPVRPNLTPYNRLRQNFQKKPKFNFAAAGGWGSESSLRKQDWTHPPSKLPRETERVTWRQSELSESMTGHTHPASFRERDRERVTWRQSECKKRGLRPRPKIRRTVCVILLRIHCLIVVDQHCEQHSTSKQKTRTPRQVPLWY